jgi:hypothetical protein
VTRRDRAAFSLALECLRWGSFASAIDVLGALPGGEAAFLACDADGARSESDDLGERLLTLRLLRARLALALRVMLRASGTEESGEPGGYAWDGCECCGGSGLRPEWYDDVDCLRCDGHGLLPSPIRMRPLWEMAPPHGGAR